MIRLVVSTRLKVAIDRHSHYVIIFHSVCFTEQQLVGFRSREGQAVAQPIPPRRYLPRKSTISKKRKHKRVGKSSQSNRAYRVV
jgi:hypothetical protein